MNPRTPKYIQDLYEYIESVPSGKFEIKVDRIKGKTILVVTDSKETLHYVDNQEAMEDLIRMINQLVGAGFSGEAHISLDMNDGNIKLIGIFDKKDTKY